MKTFNMKNNMIKIVVILLFCSTYVLGQNKIENGSSVLIKMIDGNNYQGTLLGDTESDITIDTEKLGQLTISKADIKRMVPIYPNADGTATYLFQNPNATRNIFAPTGYGLRKGEGYYHNFMLLYNSVSLGITDNITIGVGLIPIIIDDFVPITITPKISFPIVENKINLGLGAIYLSINEEQVGIAYGVATIGSKDKNFSIGTGWGYVENEWSSRPVITLSGTYRIGNKWGVVTENWLLPSYNYSFDGERSKTYMPIFSYSARYIMEPLTIDFGFINLGEIAEVFPLGIPIVGIIIPFGKPYAYRKRSRR